MAINEKYQQPWESRKRGTDLPCAAIGANWAVLWNDRICKTICLEDSAGFISGGKKYSISGI